MWNVDYYNGGCDFDSGQRNGSSHASYEGHLLAAGYPDPDARARAGLRACSSICDALGLTQSIGLKLVNRLVHTGLLRAKRGPGGGVLLAKPSSRINIGAAIRELEAGNRIDDGERHGADRASRFVNNAFDCFLEVLDNFTLQDLAGDRARLTVSDAKTLKRAVRDRGLPGAQ